jgi:hypothetical protein
MKSLHQVIVELPGRSRSHRDLLHQLLASTTDEIRVASAYVTDRELLLAGKGRNRKLLTSLDPMDIASGATSLECLRALLQSSVDIRYHAIHPRLHAKLYLFGVSDAVVTSANMTRNAMESNLEVGVKVSGQGVKELNDWYEQLWHGAERLNMKKLAALSDQVSSLRREYSKLRADAAKRFEIPRQKPKRFASSLVQAMNEGKKFYLVNTNRRYDYRTETGGYGMEESMLDQGLAVVWESFNFPGHMSAVQPGNVILAFAKKIGIVAVGVAKSGCEIISGESDKRIRPFKEYPYPEWRVPTHWIVRVDDVGALPYRDAPNASFIDVSGDQYSELRESVVDHFAS